MRRPVSFKDVFLFLSCKDVFSFCFSLPSCGFLRIRAGPPLSPSFHPHSCRLSTEAGPGVRRSHLISAVELGCLFLVCSFFFLPFFRPFPVFHREISSQDRLAKT